MIKTIVIKIEDGMVQQVFAPEDGEQYYVVVADVGEKRKRISQAEQLIEDEKLIQIFGEENSTLTLTMPNGLQLIAKLCADPAYPSIGIFQKKPVNVEELICFAEFNKERPDGHQICIGAYTSAEDDTVYYDSYNKEKPGCVTE